MRALEAGDISRTQVNREHFRKLLDPEWTIGHHETSHKSICVSLIRVIDFSEDMLVCIIQRLGQFLNDATQIAQERGSQILQLAEDPSEPVTDHKTTV